MVGKQKSGKNVVLAGLLAELGWSRTRLAAEVNAFMGMEYIGRTTVFEWVGNGRIPREPLPTVVAHLLSNAAGRHISVPDLWGEAVEESSMWLPADHGQPLTFDYWGVLHAAHDWTINVGRMMDSDRRTFMAISGAALTTIAWRYLDAPASATTVNSATGTGEAMTITPDIVNVLEAITKQIHRLDQRGGSDHNSLRLGHQQFQAVAGYVKSGNVVDEQTQWRLLAVWAQLAWRCGWMAFDAGEHGLAQRYLRTGLHITHVTGDRGLGVEFLACLVHQAIFRGQPRDAMELAEIGMRVAKDTPPAVQALAACWYANAQGANGNAYECYSAINKAHHRLDTPGAPESKPEWLNYLDSNALQSRLGWSLISLAQADRSKASGYLEKADTILGPRVVSDTLFARDSLYYSVWLARSYVWRGELEKAVQTGKVCLQLMPKVRSPRAIGLARQFINELKQHHGSRGNRHVTELTNTLRTSTTCSF